MEIAVSEGGDSTIVYGVEGIGDWRAHAQESMYM